MTHLSLNGGLLLILLGQILLHPSSSFAHRKFLLLRPEPSSSFSSFKLKETIWQPAGGAPLYISVGRSTATHLAVAQRNSRGSGTKKSSRSSSNKNKKREEEEAEIEDVSVELITVPDDDEDDDSDVADEKPTMVKNTISPKNTVSKFRKLKDIMWVREAVEDVTAAEFACSVESEREDEDERGSGRKKKRAVDYEKLLSNLNRRIGDMLCESVLEINRSSPKLNSDQGMGRYAYSKEQREDLLETILRARQNLLEVMKGHAAVNNRHNQEGGGDGENGFGFELPEMPELPDLRVDIPKEDENSASSGPRLYVRDDGTVDWEGALQDRAALRKFGGAVWARINGQTPDVIPEDGDVEALANNNHMSHEKPAVTAKIEETPAIKEAREELERLQKELTAQEKAHRKLLKSGISAGQAVANVKLASLDPELRAKIRLSAEELHVMEQQVSYQSLVYELERIYTYLATELGNPAAKGYVPLQDRLNVAEYGLLESQVENCSRELNAKGVLDADILAVIAEQMLDFKRRLGIDYYVTGLSYDAEAIQSWLLDLAGQAKNGLLFYVKGCRLFWDDILYCSSLVARAAQGYTLKPREVRTIRRTFKDLITFIPVIIILLIPLSPVGHVLVFGAIQRFFPDFFPSCFTEQRQNLLQLYETTEFSEFTIKESLQDRFERFLQAVGFLMVSKSREFYESLISPSDRKDDDSSAGKDKN